MTANLAFIMAEIEMVYHFNILLNHLIVESIILFMKTDKMDLKWHSNICLQVLTNSIGQYSFFFKIQIMLFKSHW